VLQVGGEERRRERRCQTTGPGDPSLHPSNRQRENNPEDDKEVKSKGKSKKGGGVSKKVKRRKRGKGCHRKKTNGILKGEKTLTGLLLFEWNCGSAQLKEKTGRETKRVRPMGEKSGKVQRTRGNLNSWNLTGVKERGKKKKEAAKMSDYTKSLNNCGKKKTEMEMKEKGDVHRQKKKGGYKWAARPVLIRVG